MISEKTAALAERYCCLRMDDVGASTKWFNLHGDPTIPWSNFLFLKCFPPFGKWGVYNELGADTWRDILDLLRKYDAKLTVGVTACWVSWSGRLTPFPERFPEAAAVLREGQREGLLEIANHGLTHCVLKDHLFRPKLFAPNRKYHREFWDWIPLGVQEEHIKMSQEILQGYFGCAVRTFIPPGNVWTPDTEILAHRHGLEILSSSEAKSPSLDQSNGLTYYGDVLVSAFHDREIRTMGLAWLEKHLKTCKYKTHLNLQEFHHLASGYPTPDMLENQI